MTDQYPPQFSPGEPAPHFMDPDQPPPQAQRYQVPQAQPQQAQPYADYRQADTMRDLVARIHKVITDQVPNGRGKSQLYTITEDLARAFARAIDAEPGQVLETQQDDEARRNLERTRERQEREREEAWRQKNAAQWDPREMQQQQPQGESHYTPGTPQPPTYTQAAPPQPQAPPQAPPQHPAGEQLESGFVRPPNAPPPAPPVPPAAPQEFDPNDPRAWGQPQPRR